jgi:zinc/manganese transport system substrate-binding protein
MLNRRNVIIFSGLCAAPFGLSPLRAQTPALPVLASFSILADLVRQIGGERVTVSELVGPNQDAHGFEPGPQHVRKVAEAKVIFVNGLGLEPYMARLVKSAGTQVKPVVLAAGITPLDKPKKADAHGHGHGHAHGHENHDPHAWQSVKNVKTFARGIAAALSAADPAGKTAYDARLTTYLAALDALEKEIGDTVASIPAERRMLVTTHNAFRYFGRDFGLKTEALQGVSAETEPSAADMAKIIRQLKALKASAVFLENVTDPRKIEQIARESGAKVGGTLYSDALSLANGPAPTYIDMMRHNVRQIVQALKP